MEGMPTHRDITQTGVQRTSQAEDKPTIDPTSVMQMQMQMRCACGFEPKGAATVGPFWAGLQIGVQTGNSETGSNCEDVGRSH